MPVLTAPAHCDGAGITCLGVIAIGDCHAAEVKSVENVNLMGFHEISLSGIFADEPTNSYKHLIDLLF